MLLTARFPDPVLTTHCVPYDFSIPAVQQEFNLPEFLDAMAPHMKAEKGIGLAANQVGKNVRIFIMLDSKGSIVEFINPEIIDRDGMIALNEGCLSAPGAFVQLPRSQTVTVKALDRNGVEFTVVCQDLEAVCVQHEIDHLDGLFFIEKAPRQQRRHAMKVLGLK